ncbi:MAG: asparagine synthase, partial [Gammaproteobacteria bacterium]
MDGIFGWLGEHGAHQDLIQHMAKAARLSPASALDAQASPAFGVAGASRFGKASIHVEDGLAVACFGRPRFDDAELTATARQRSPAAALAQGWRRLGEQLPRQVQGNFAFAVLEAASGQAFLA